MTDQPRGSAADRWLPREPYKGWPEHRYVYSSEDGDSCSCGWSPTHFRLADQSDLTPAQEEAIKRIAAQPPGIGRTAAFLRCVLGERSYFEIAVMSWWLRNDPPLTEAEMRYMAERWHADAA